MIPGYTLLIYMKKKYFIFMHFDVRTQQSLLNKLNKLEADFTLQIGDGCTYL